MRSGQPDSITSLAAEQSQAGRDITRMMYVAFLAPDIVETIARGEQPISLTSLLEDWRHTSTTNIGAPALAGALAGARAERLKQETDHGDVIELSNRQISHDAVAADARR